MLPALEYQCPPLKLRGVKVVADQLEQKFSAQNRVRNKAASQMKRLIAITNIILIITLYLHN